MSNIVHSGIGGIKISKQEDGTYVASANGIPSVSAPTESAAILAINNAIKQATSENEKKMPFRILG